MCQIAKISRLIVALIRYRIYPLRLHSFSDKVVFVHGSGPLTDGGAGTRDLGDGSRCEVFIVNVRLDLSYDSIRNIVLHITHYVCEQHPSIIMWLYHRCTHVHVCINVKLDPKNIAPHKNYKCNIHVVRKIYM